MKNRNKELLLLVFRNVKTHIYTVRNGFMWICLNVKVKVAQLRLTLCNPMDYIVHGILQARILEWVAIPFSRGSSQPRDCTQVSRITGRFFTSWATRETHACNKWTSKYSSWTSKGDGNSSVSSVAQSCPTLCDPMNRSTPGLPVHHQLPESTQTHVHWVSDTIQPSHPLSFPSPPALNLSQHQGLFKWVSSSHQVAKVLEFQLQNQSFQWTPRTDLL